MLVLATVTVTSPLAVRIDGATTATDAKVIGGSSYSPALNGRVIVTAVSGRLYVLGAA